MDGRSGNIIEFRSHEYQKRKQDIERLPKPSIGGKWPKQLEREHNVALSTTYSPPC